MPTIVDDHGLPLISIADEPEDDVLRRLAVLPPPSAHAVASGSRRDVVLEAELAMQIYSISRQLRRAIAIRIAWAVRRIRRELGR